MWTCPDLPNPELLMCLLVIVLVTILLIILVSLVLVVLVLLLQGRKEEVDTGQGRR